MKKAVPKNIKHKRPSWDEYFFGIVNSVGLRATCDKSGSGCVIVFDNRLIATGYTGSLSGLPHCDEVGHDMQADYCIRTIHAEQNATTQALKFGISLDGATMYCKAVPCPACAKMAESLGVTRVVVE